MDTHGRPALATHPLCEADVIRMAMGEDDRPDVLDRAAHRGKLGWQVLPVPGHPGVDDGELP